MTDRCDYCGRRKDRPGFGCELDHPIPNVYQRCVAAIEADIRDRRWLGVDDLNDESLDHTRDYWTKLIQREFLAESERGFEKMREIQSRIDRESGAPIAGYIETPPESG